MEKKKSTYFYWSLINCAPTLGVGVMLNILGMSYALAFTVAFFLYAVDVGHSWKEDLMEDRIKELEKKLGEK